MNGSCASGSERGFALVITVALLGLLVLTVLALSALARVNSRIALAALRQTQARQQALVACQFALGQLQQHAGVEARVTAMAGVTGLGASASNTTRHWCGVWTATGDFIAWLASGAVPTPVANFQSGALRIKLVDQGTVGAAQANSEPVEVGKLPVEVFDPVIGATKTIGYFAYWVGDEGVKISAYSPSAALPSAGLLPILADQSPTADLRAALTAYSVKVSRVISYEQLALLPMPDSVSLAPGVLKDCFHHTSLTTWRLKDDASGLYAGVFNVNTNSAIAWRGLLETYNAAALGPPLVGSLDITHSTSLPRKIADRLAAAHGTGKAAQAPFQSVVDFENSLLLDDALTETGNTLMAADFKAAIHPLLSTRSDTFRIRGYGDVVDPIDQTTVRARAYCEAIVRRTTELAASGLEHKFEVTYFRWLAPENI